MTAHFFNNAQKFVDDTGKEKKKTATLLYSSFLPL